jgi:CheY-like chemotaxis protein
MNLGKQPSTTKPPAKLSILLMDVNAERRALRKKILALHGAEVVGASDLTEANSIWHRDRYDLVLMDIRTDHRGCLSWRDEIKKEKPQQIVAFLVGRPRYIDLEPLADSYVAEEYGVQWGDALRRAVREACGSLPQRNGFVEAGWRIATARRMSGAPPRNLGAREPAETPLELSYVPNEDQNEPAPSGTGEEAPVISAQSTNQLSEDQSRKQ